MKYYVCFDHTSKEPKESATTAMTAMQSLQSNVRSVSLLLLPTHRSTISSDGLRSKGEVIDGDVRRRASAACGEAGKTGLGETAGE